MLSTLDLIVKFTYEKCIPIHSTRGVLMRRLASGERERHLRAMEDATSSPGRTRAASPATRSRPGPTTVKGIKGQDAALARRKARGVTLHAQGPAIRARPGVTHSRAGLA